MTEIDTMVLRFSGSKLELKQQLKKYCELSGKTMNGTVLELIQKLLATRENEGSKTQNGS